MSRKDNVLRLANSIEPEMALGNASIVPEIDKCKSSFDFQPLTEEQQSEFKAKSRGPEAQPAGKNVLVLLSGSTP